MIQLGGIGYMTLGSFILLARRHHLPARNEEVAKLTFVLPEGFKVQAFLRNVIVFTVLIQITGAAALYAAFQAEGVENAVWQAIFHAISAFCTAGFSLFPNSLEGFAGNFWVNAVISMLSLSGAIGFLVLSDFFWSFTGLRERRTLTTKIILHATFWTLLLGWALLFLIEPSYRELPSERRLMASGFQAMDFSDDGRVQYFADWRSGRRPNVSDALVNDYRSLSIWDWRGAKIDVRLGRFRRGLEYAA